MVEILLYVLGVVLFIGAIFVSIALHEYGHLHFAKKYGCRVSEYMVGFGPRVASWTRGETEYGLKLIPLGGYVKIIGMFPPEQIRGGNSRGTTRASGAFPPEQIRGENSRTSTVEVAEQTTDADGETVTVLRKSNTGLFAQMVSETRSTERETIRPGDEDRLFYKLPWHRKVMTMLAGPAVNIALAFCCFLGVYSVYGVHTIEPVGTTTVASVSDCVIPESAGRTACTENDPVSPAKAAGMHDGDRIVAFNDQQITNWTQLQDLIHANGKDTVTFTVEREGKDVELHPVRTVVMERDLAGADGTSHRASVGFVGITPDSQEVVTRHGPFYTMSRMGEMTAHAVSSVADLPGKVWNVAQAITGNAERDREGPMSIVGGSRLAGEVASSDAEGLQVGDKAALLALVVGSFNLFMGVFNLIPLLPLDGGHIAGAIWEQLRRVLARVLRRPAPGYVDVAKQLPIAYCLGLALVTMSLVLIVGDIVVPLSSGL